MSTTTAHPRRHRRPAGAVKRPAAGAGASAPGSVGRRADRGRRPRRALRPSHESGGRRAGLPHRRGRTRRPARAGLGDRHAAADQHRRRRLGALGPRRRRVRRRERRREEGPGAGPPRHARVCRIRSRGRKPRWPRPKRASAQAEATVREVDAPRRAAARGVAPVGRQGAVEDRDGDRRSDAGARRRRSPERGGRGDRGPRHAQLRPHQPVQGVDPLADRRHRAEAVGRARPDRGRLPAGRDPVHDCRGPAPDGARSRRRRSRRGPRGRRPDRDLLGRRLSRPDLRRAR